MRPFLTDPEIARRIRQASRHLGEIRVSLAPMRDEIAAASIDAVRLELEQLAEDVHPVGDGV